MAVTTSRSVILSSLSSPSTLAADESDLKSLSSASDEEDVEVVLLQSSEQPDESDLIFADKISDDDDDGFNFYVPKYFQAILTLLACGLLLFISLAIIQQTRRLCHKSSCASSRKIPLSHVGGSDKSRKDNSFHSKSNYNHPDSIVVTEQNTKKNANGETTTSQQPPAGDRHYDIYNPPLTSPAAAEDQKDAEAKAQDLLKLKRVRFVRRVSGTFSDDAIEFAGQTYKAKYKEAAHPQKPGEINPRNQSIRKPSHHHPSHAPPPVPPQ